MAVNPSVSCAGGVTPSGAPTTSTYSSLSETFFGTGPVSSRIIFWLLVILVLIEIYELATDKQ